MADLTLAQRQALKAHILADQTLAANLAALQYQEIADALNLNASPVTNAWRTNVNQEEMVQETVDQIAAYDNLTAGKRDAWGVFLALGGYDMTKNKIRSAVGKVWANTQRDAILSNVCVEKATRAEVAVGGASVTEGAVTALKRDWTGILQAQDIGPIAAA